MGSQEKIFDVELQLSEKTPKSLLISYMLAMPPFGWLGAHHYYLDRHRFGTLYMFTVGYLLLGWVLDLVRMPYLVDQANKKRQGVLYSERDTQDAYMLWLSPFGCLGFHQYYLGRYFWGFLYTLTIGLVGVGWVVDGFRMKRLITSLDKHAEKETDNNEMDKELSDAYVLLLCPLGPLGAHQ